MDRTSYKKVCRPSKKKRKSREQWRGRALPSALMLLLRSIDPPAPLVVVPLPRDDDHLRGARPEDQGFRFTTDRSPLYSRAFSSPWESRHRDDSLPNSGPATDVFCAWQAMDHCLAAEREGTISSGEACKEAVRSHHLDGHALASLPLYGSGSKAEDVDSYAYGLLLSHAQCGAAESAYALVW